MPRTRKVIDTSTEEVPVQPQFDPRDLPAGSEGKTFWEHMESIPQENWERERYCVYLYRLEPPAGKVEGEPAYLKKYIRAFTIEEVQNEFGGGKYMYWMKRNQEQICRGTFRVAGDPKSPQGAQVSAPAGETNVVGLLGEVIQRLDTARSSGADLGKVVEQSQQILTSAYKTSLESIARNPSAAPAESPWDKILVALIPKLVENLTKPAADPLAQIDRVLGVMEKLKSGATGEGGGDWKSSLATSIGNKLDSLLDRGAEIARNYNEAQQHRAAAVLAAKGFQVRLANQPGTPTATPRPEAATSQTATPTESTGQPEMPVVSMGDWIKAKLVEMLMNGKDGDEAGVVADNMDSEFAGKFAEAIKTDPGALAKDPMFAQAIHHPNLRKFCADYVAYFEEDEEPEPVAAEVSEG